MATSATTTSTTMTGERRDVGASGGDPGGIFVPSSPPSPATGLRHACGAGAPWGVARGDWPGTSTGEQTWATHPNRSYAAGYNNRYEHAHANMVAQPGA